MPCVSKPANAPIAVALLLCAFDPALSPIATFALVKVLLIVLILVACVAALALAKVCYALTADKMLTPFEKLMLAFCGRVKLPYVPKLHSLPVVLVCVSI